MPRRWHHVHGVCAVRQGGSVAARQMRRPDNAALVDQTRICRTRLRCDCALAEQRQRVAHPVVGDAGDQRQRRWLSAFASARMLPRFSIVRPSRTRAFYPIFGWSNSNSAGGWRAARRSQPPSPYSGETALTAQP
jgi:hypothetical protein